MIEGRLMTAQADWLHTKPSISAATSCPKPPAATKALSTLNTDAAVKPSLYNCYS